MKLQEIIELSQCFQSLMNEKLPKDWKYVIATNFVIIKPYLEGYQAAVRSVIVSHTVEGKTNSMAVDMEMAPMLERDEDVKLVKLPKDALNQYEFTLGQHIILGMLVE